ncbi:neutral zinc metallopeptidase [Nocardioides bizhenqiangii]|uniref:Neutral zinc metallopeptidase n=1 Tax=Nocardioides bizhenqiangii TaxID=3095076 RepID=A0ABZ0ZYI9_9ACTN|nr:MULTISPECIES: neutral zinc metallopeptidase [unclassified Nocardioides]MDZ5623267.1 neutral zinc metallopeptidase [Nocardioides sp. HM23]WQQ28238.1 neutral zinc metallopeptidase [Nocardioides sp. HM61]
MHPTRLAGLVALALVGPLSLAGCGGDDDDSASDPETVATVTVPPSPAASETTTTTEPPTESVTTDTTDTTESMTIAPTGTVDEEELAGDIDSAVAITDDWWQRHWKDYFTGRYTPPNVVGLYDGYDEASAPTCFGESLPPGNAFYCPDGDYVAWDKTLLELGYEIGDAWPYLIIAHEWGHAIQADLSMELQSEKYELQADCLAAAVLYGQEADGNLTFEDGDEKEIVDGLNFIADEVPWGMSGDHGDSFQRIEAFNLGRTAGVPGCLPGMTN